MTMISGEMSSEAVKRRSIHRKSFIGDTSIVVDSTLKVVDYIEKPFHQSKGRAEIKTVYIVVVTDSKGREWSTEKSYSDFNELYKLSHSHQFMKGVDDFSFPSKHLYHNVEVKESRKRSFDRFLKLLLEKKAYGLLFSFVVDCERSWESTLSSFAEDDEVKVSTVAKEDTCSPNANRDTAGIKKDLRAVWLLRSALTILIFSLGYLSATVFYPQHEVEPLSNTCSFPLSVDSPREYESPVIVKDIAETSMEENDGSIETAATSTASQREFEVFTDYKERALWSFSQFMVAFTLLKQVVKALPWRRLSLARFLFAQLFGVAFEIILGGLSTSWATESVIHVIHTFRLMLFGAVIFVRYSGI